MTEKCTDYDGYKKGTATSQFKSKCGTALWKSEEDMRNNLNCYDEAHSRSKCITFGYLKTVEKDLEDYLKSYKTPLCNELQESISSCLGQTGSMYRCSREVRLFLGCMSTTVREIFMKRYEERKRAGFTSDSDELDEY